VADDKFHCIILKGGDQYPYFPRPLLSEFAFSVPLYSGALAKQKSAEDDDAEMVDADAAETADEGGEMRKLEQQFVLGTVQSAQLHDLEHASSSRHVRARRDQVDMALDKTLLLMLAGECRAGEERGMRALELVGLVRDPSGRVLEAAGKVAQRYGRTVLGEKIRDLVEERVGDGDEDDVFG